MSYLVPREIPKKCHLCPCFRYDLFDGDIDGFCKALLVEITNSNYRHPSCPLVEIPTPHGRLGDLDKLKRKAQKVSTEAWKMKLTAKIETTINQFIDWIDELETIVEAE